MMMRKLLIISFVFLAACQENSQTHDLGLQNPSAPQGIVGGMAVPAKDRLARMVFSLVSNFPEGTGVNASGAMTELTAMGYQCTASALTSRLVVTAAHCVENKDLVHHLELTDAEGNKITNKVAEFKVHPQYATDDRADLALLLLEEDLPEGTLYPNFPEGGEYLDLRELIAVGYGRVTGEKLREGKAGILRWGLMDAKSYNPSEPVFHIDQTVGRGICSGDSGGPAYVQDDGLKIVGVASKVSFYSFPGDDNPDACAFRGTLVNLQYHLEWLAKTAESLLNSKN